eukprot:gnl/Carplike_NY0171/2382_a3206_693.p1 GENE.gnl/Carplike_NY0171/2382_a3206_693~~gnl/Carplike_NY0171/2382_a3206_693.p1  ORF type:complete len:692 (+),score=246.61 gnl/Carplike_NY0171/2382_a3206_693:2-2077(+)
MEGGRPHDSHADTIYQLLQFDTFPTMSPSTYQPEDQDRGFYSSGPKQHSPVFKLPDDVAQSVEKRLLAAHEEKLKRHEERRERYYREECPAHPAITYPASQISSGGEFGQRLYSQGIERQHSLEKRRAERDLELADRSLGPKINEPTLYERHRPKNMSIFADLIEKGEALKMQKEAARKAKERQEQEHFFQPMINPHSKKLTEHLDKPNKTWIDRLCPMPERDEEGKVVALSPDKKGKKDFETEQNMTFQPKITPYKGSLRNRPSFTAKMKKQIEEQSEKNRIARRERIAREQTMEKEKEKVVKPTKPIKSDEMEVKDPASKACIKMYDEYRIKKARAEQQARELANNPELLRRKLEQEARNAEMTREQESKTPIFKRPEKRIDLQKPQYLPKAIKAHREEDIKSHLWRMRRGRAEREMKRRAHERGVTVVATQKAKEEEKMRIQLLSGECPTLSASQSPRKHPRKVQTVLASSKVVEREVDPDENQEGYLAAVVNYANDNSDLKPTMPLQVDSGGRVLGEHSPSVGGTPRTGGSLAGSQEIKSPTSSHPYPYSQSQIKSIRPPVCPSDVRKAMNGTLDWEQKEMRREEEKRQKELEERERIEHEKEEREKQKEREEREKREGPLPEMVPLPQFNLNMCSMLMSAKGQALLSRGRVEGENDQEYVLRRKEKDKIQRLDAAKEKSKPWRGDL